MLGHLPELLIVLVLALVVFGPKRLPEIGAAMGRGIREFRRGTSDLLDHDLDRDDVPVSPPPAQVKPTPPEYEASAAAQQTGPAAAEGADHEPH